MGSGIAEVSARAGLDVVQDMVKSVGGVVRVTSKPGQGTRFTLQLWRVRPFVGIGKRIFGRKPAKGAQPLHDPIEIELR